MPPSGLPAHRLTDNPGAIHPADLIGRYERLMVDLRGAFGRDPDRSREISLDLLGEIRLQPEDEEFNAAFETRPERNFMTERIASDCGCRDPQPPLSARATASIQSSIISAQSRLDPISAWVLGLWKEWK